MIHIFYDIKSIYLIKASICALPIEYIANNAELSYHNVDCAIIIRIFIDVLNFLSEKPLIYKGGKYVGECF